MCSKHNEAILTAAPVYAQLYKNPLKPHSHHTDFFLESDPKMILIVTMETFYAKY